MGCGGEKLEASRPSTVTARVGRVSPPDSTGTAARSGDDGEADSLAVFAALHVSAAFASVWASDTTQAARTTIATMATGTSRRALNITEHSTTRSSGPQMPQPWHHEGMDVERRARAARTGRWFQYLTMVWNAAECVVALIAGFVAGSIALVGFGFDSAVEVTSSVAALWRLHHDPDEARREAAEQRAARIIGVCFLLVAAYVLNEAGTALAERAAPGRSDVGLALAALSLIVMPVLVRYKRRVATRLGSGALEAETRQTGVCAYLSAILLAGLGLNAWLGWWWADPVAAPQDKKRRRTPVRRTPPLRQHVPLFFIFFGAMLLGTGILIERCWRRAR